MIHNNELATFEQMGRTALMPGMVYMLEQMQRILDEFKEQLNGVVAPKRRGRPPGKSKKPHPRDPDHPDHAKWLRAMRAGSKARWNAISKAERKAVVDRLMEARKKKGQIVNMRVAS